MQIERKLIIAKPLGNTVVQTICDGFLASAIAGFKIMSKQVTAQRIIHSTECTLCSTLISYLLLRP